MAWVAVATAAVGAGTAIYSNVQANKREKRAQNALSALSKEAMPEYAPTPQQKQYESLVLNGLINPRGLPAAQRAASQEATTRAINTNLYNMRGVTGGNQSRLLGNALTPVALDASNEAALLDVKLKNDNYNRMLGAYGGVANASQRISDMNTGGALNRRLLTERALGNSVLQNQAFKQQSLSNFSSDLMGAGGSLAAYKYANRKPRDNSEWRQGLRTTPTRTDYYSIFGNDPNGINQIPAELN